MHTKIENWAMYKEWSSLSPQEQSQVLKQMNRAEYQRLYQQMQAIKALDAAVLPPAHLRTRLMEHLAMQPALTAKTLWWHRQIPAWQAAAAMLIVVLSTFWMSSLKPIVPTSTIVQVRDTLVQEKIVWREKVVQKIKVVYRDRDSIQLVPNPQKGVSLEDAPELLGLFTQAEK